MSFIINGRIDTDEEGVITLCCENRPVPRMTFSSSPEEILTNFVGLRTRMLTESIRRVQSNAQPGSEKFTSGCVGCALYRRAEWHPSMQITGVNLSMYPAPCQCRCIYCVAYKQWSDTRKVREAYERLFDTLELAEASGLIAGDARWQVSTGEITIHPYRKRIIELVRGRKTRFFTNCFIFDEDIAQNLSEDSESAINLSIDAGTPETWKRVKGFSNFDKVTSNLVKYYKRCAKPGQITLKYIVLPDINDTYEDYMSLMEIMKVLETAHLEISRDGMIKYNMTAEVRTKLIGATAYLAAMCRANGITYDLTPFSSEERIEISGLADEILSTGQV